MRPKETSNKKSRSCKMTFLPKNAQSGHETLNLLIGLPLTLLATGLLFFVIETGSRAFGA